MNKAKIILTSIALLAVVGAALAFNVMRTTIGRTYTFTDEYTQGTVVYQLPNQASFCINTEAKFWTDVRPNPVAPLVTAYRTTVAPTTTITLTSGVLTKTIPLHTCVSYTFYTTNNI